MSEFSVSLAKLAEEANLTIAYTPCELEKIQVTATEVYRPGILLAGYYENFDSKRIQIIGLTEMSYLDELTTTLRNTHLEKLFSFQPPAVVLSRGMQPLSEMMQYGKKYGVPILMSTEMTSALMGQLITTLNTELAPRITRHGVLVEVYGEGILILGDSGVGKSETAIELVKRGHRLIADDAVELRRVSYRKILGTAPANIRHFIELRGIGIINVARVFGIGSVRSSVEVEMVVQLEPWDRTKNYDRTGLETEYYDILGVKVPSMLIPVMPGRNLAVILETAAINNRQKEMGYNAKALGYCALAVTDHAPAMPDAPHAWHFGNWSAMPRTIDGVAILYGAEANVMDTKGGLDLSQSQLKAQDWVVASIHSACVPGLLTRREANRLWLAVAENPYVDCIGHSEQENYRYDYDLVTRAFAKNHKVVELNGNSFNVRKDGIPNMRALLAACLANGCRIAVDSDAHSTYQLQHGLCALYAMLEEMQFPQELIVNATRENLVRELQLHGKPCAEEVGGILL